MTSIVEVMDCFEHCISDSAQDSVAAIERQFSLAQTRHGWDVAIRALATVYLVAEQRRRYIAAENEINRQ